MGCVVSAVVVVVVGLERGSSAASVVSELMGAESSGSEGTGAAGGVAEDAAGSSVVAVVAAMGAVAGAGSAGWDSVRKLSGQLCPRSGREGGVGGALRVVVGVAELDAGVEEVVLVDAGVACVL